MSPRIKLFENFVPYKNLSLGLSNYISEDRGDGIWWTGGKSTTQEELNERIKKDLKEIWPDE